MQREECRAKKRRRLGKALAPKPSSFLGRKLFSLHPDFRSYIEKNSEWPQNFFLYRTENRDAKRTIFCQETTTVWAPGPFQAVVVSWHDILLFASRSSVLYRKKF